MRVSRHLLVLLLLLGSGSSLRAQAPTMQWRTQFGVRRGIETVTPILHTRHNRLLIGCGTRLYNGPSPFSSATTWLLNTRGDSLRSTMYFPQSTTESSGVIAMAESPNGDFLLLGLHSNNVNGQITIHHMLLRTDSLGRQRWVRYYNANSAVEVQSCLALPDGGALLVVSCNDPAGSLAYPIRVPTVLRVDSLGNTLWKRQ